MNSPPKHRGFIWIVFTIFSTVVLLVFYAAVTVYIDPLFHYHAPQEQYQYPIEDQRYQGDGILRNFQYGGGNYWKFCHGAVQNF